MEANRNCIKSCLGSIVKFPVTVLFQCTGVILDIGLDITCLPSCLHQLFANLICSVQIIHSVHRNELFAWNGYLLLCRAGFVGTVRLFELTFERKPKTMRYVRLNSSLALLELCDNSLWVCQHKQPTSLNTLLIYKILIKSAFIQRVSAWISKTKTFW